MLASFVVVWVIMALLGLGFFWNSLPENDGIEQVGAVCLIIMWPAALAVTILAIPAVLVAWLGFLLREWAEFLFPRLFK